MKVAISLADDLYQRAERLVLKRGGSRSAIYARAIEEYVERHDSLTEQANEWVASMTEEDKRDERMVVEAGKRTARKYAEW